MRTGFGQYFMGTSPLFLLASALFRLFRHPVLYGSAAMLWGYASSAARRLPRYDDPAFRAFLRRYQLQCLLRGKRAATRRLDEAQAAVWHAAHRPQEAMEADRPDLLGCRFDRVTMRDAVARCLAWCAEPRRPHTVVTANASTLSLMRREPALREACERADLVVPDGMSVVWTSRLAGLGLPERVAGVDLMVRLLDAASEQRLSIYLLGARPNVVNTLARRCQTDWPGLTVAGVRDGYFGPEAHAEVIDDIRRAAPHILFVGMPSPFKETWCETHRDALGVPVILGVGGTFDVLAGYVRRAPRPVQAAGLEWAWRLAMEPRRLWRRYLLSNTEFAWLAAGAVLKRRAGLARYAR